MARAPSTYLRKGQDRCHATHGADHRFVLNARPAVVPNDSTMRLEKVAIAAPQACQMPRSHDLSLDPYMRGMMSDRDSYAVSVPLGWVMAGAAIAEVQQVRLDGYAEGDRVMSYGGWQDHAVGRP